MRRAHGCACDCCSGLIVCDASSTCAANCTARQIDNRRATRVRWTLGLSRTAAQMRDEHTMMAATTAMPGRAEPHLRNSANAPLNVAIVGSVRWLQTVRDVRLRNPPPATPRLINEDLERVVRRAPGPKPERALEHVSLEDRLNDDLRSCLHNTVTNPREVASNCTSCSRDFGLCRDDVDGVRDAVAAGLLKRRGGTGFRAGCRVLGVRRGGRR